MTALPQGWENAKIGSILEVARGGSPRPIQAFLTSDKNGLNWIKISDATASGSRIQKTKQKIRPDGLSKTRAVKPGDFLLSNSMSFGRPYICDIEGCIHDGWLVLGGVEKLFDQDFLYHCLRSDSVQRQFSQKAAGSTVQNLNSDLVRDVVVPIPPLPEQRRIVRKLDTLTARTTTARTHLTAIERLVERYKRLVIGQLCLGGVAAQFQDQGDLPALPTGWEWSRAEDLCHWITKGTTPAKGELFSDGGDVPFIKVYNLTFSERLDFSINPTFVSSRTHDVALKRSKLFPGDVLINIVGPPLGKTAIVPDSFPEWNMNQAIAVFRPKERLFNRFLLYWLSSEWFLSWALSRSKATAGQRNLTLEICRDTPVPLPSFEEQREIVRRIETAFEKIDRLAVEAAKALKLVGHLDQRVLAKAFAGELVPPDPTDEPAETLLARIREAREAAPKPKRKRKTPA